MKINLKESLKDYYLRTLNWFYPNCCAFCHCDLPYHDKKRLCASCKNSIHFVPDPFCVKCGIHLPDGGMHCRHCKKEKYHFSYIRSAAVFKNVLLRDLVHQFKYNEKESLSGDLSELLCRAWKRYPEIQDAETIIPVPLYPANLRERGFNQSELLAKGLIILLNRHYEEKLVSDPPPQLLENILVRVRKTTSQTRLSREERLMNVESAFLVKNDQPIHSKTVLLIDDVCTTGATLNECAKVLKKSGAKKVYGLTLARD